MEWRDVAGYDYMVSDQGDVYSKLTERILKPYRDPHGYLQVSLTRNGKQSKVRVHVLALEAFVGPRPEGALACHRNDQPADNRLENLYWGTKSHNGVDCVRNGANANRNKTHCKQGHEYTPENTYISKRGGRFCRACHNRRGRERRQGQKSSAVTTAV